MISSNLTNAFLDGFPSSLKTLPVIETEFEKNCNCDVQYVSTGQAGTLANEIFLKDKDVILGVEMHEFDYTSENWNIYDYGYFSFIYNEETLKDIPNSFEELINASIECRAPGAKRNATSTGISTVYRGKNRPGNKTNFDHDIDDDFKI